MSMLDRSTAWQSYEKHDPKKVCVSPEPFGCCFLGLLDGFKDVLTQHVQRPQLSSISRRSYTKSSDHVWWGLTAPPVHPA